MAPKNTIVSLADLEQVAMPMATQQARDYWSSGANEMVTVRENHEAFNNYRIRARAMVDVSQVDISPKKDMFGLKYKLPLGIAPTAYHSMAIFDGENATARAARAKNWPMGLSSYATKSYAEVKDNGGDSAAFFQLYVFKNRDTTKHLVKLVEAKGYKALVLTVDTPFLGLRYSDVKNDFQLPSHLTLGNFPKETVPGLVDISANNRMENTSTAGSDANVLDPSLNWAETIPWLRSITKMEIWVKGVATAEDAQLALDAGVDGIWVSNHGGRQLDSTVPTLESLPEVVEAVNGKVPVHVDGGVRTGGDVFKALALGADFVWVGRPALHGLQYDGQRGVELMCSIIEAEFKYVMAMAGCTSTDKINKKCIVRYGPTIQKL